MAHRTREDAHGRASTKTQQTRDNVCISRAISTNGRQAQPQLLIRAQRLERSGLVARHKSVEMWAFCDVIGVALSCREVVALLRNDFRAFLPRYTTTQPWTSPCVHVSKQHALVRISTPPTPTSPTPVQKPSTATARPSVRSAGQGSGHDFLMHRSLCFVRTPISRMQSGVDCPNWETLGTPHVHGTSRFLVSRLRVRWRKLRMV